jgi:hypothetical protein
MDNLSLVERLLNNQSVGAFLGAFTAFALVVLNDWRRDRRKVRNIRAEIEMNVSVAKAKLETMLSNRTALRDENRIIPAPILRFNTTLIRQLSAEVLDWLGVDRRRAIEALCYNMEATDGVLQEAYDLTKRLSTTPLDSERVVIGRQILNEYDDAIANLQRVVEMCADYVAGRFTVITSKQYDRADYEHP